MAVKTWEAEVVVDMRAVVGEGPVWDDRGKLLWWVDIGAQAVHAYDPATDENRPTTFPQPVGAIALREEGDGMLGAVQDGFAFLDTDAGTLEMLAEVEKDRNTRMNDGKCDAAGRMWAGTMGFDLAPKAGGFYRFDPDRSVTTILDDVTLSNGLGWSPDGKTMYYIDSMAYGVDAFDFDVDGGRISNRRRVIDLPESEGLGDGMCVDAEGYLWVSLFYGGCVRRFSPDGELAGIVELPVTQVTCCAFGGDDLSDLYVTTAAAQLDEEALQQYPHSGALFRLSPGVQGLPAHRFAG